MGLLSFLKKSYSSQSQIGDVLQKYGKKPKDIEDVYYKLLISGSGPRLAKKVIENPKLLSEFFEAKGTIEDFIFNHGGPSWP